MRYRRIGRVLSLRKWYTYFVTIPSVAIPSPSLSPIRRRFSSMMETSKPSSSNTLASYRSPSRRGNEPQRTNPLAWWYWLTAPSEPPANASLAQREAARRGRLSSTILLVMIVHVGIAIPVGIITGNTPLLTTLIVTLVIDGIALLFNRRGKRFV